MYKAMLVEDHKWTMEGIVRTIDWISLGIELKHVCVDGSEALRLLIESPVDLIITDIRMGEMDGIQLTKEAKLLYRDIQIIIISAYQDFSYAYEALNLGAMAYILKPIDSADLMAKIKGAVEAIDKVNKKNPALLDYLVQCTLTENAVESEYNDKLTGKEFRILLIPIQKNMDDLQKAKKKLDSINYVFHSFFHNNFIISLIHYQNTICNETAEDYGSITEEWPVAAIGSPSNGASGLNSSYINALKAYEYCFVNSISGICKYDKTMNIYGAENTGNVIDYNKVIFNALSDEAKYMEQELDKVFNILHEKKISSEIVRACVFELLTRIDGYFKSVRGESLYDKLNIKDTLTEVKKLHSFNDLKHYTKNVFMIATRILSGFDDCKTHPITQRAIKYVRSNIGSKNLSLSSVAKAIDINYVYLSKLFKEDYGINFTDYINKCRVDTAKELLKVKDKKIKDICAEIGLEQKYFHHLFKKYEGITPNNYRSMLP